MKLGRISLMITLLAGLSVTAPNALPARAATIEPAAVERLLNPDGSLNLNSGFRGALDLRGWNVSLDSTRGPVFVRRGRGLEPLPNVAQARPAGSFALGAAQPVSPTLQAMPHGGLNGDVVAFAIDGGDLYVGGYFNGTFDGAITSGGIAKFSGGAWSALPNGGLGGPALAFAIKGSELYVGGWFSQTADGAVTNLNNIARFSGGVWSALPHGGLNNEVRALGVSGSDLFVGGYFQKSFDDAVTLNRIARFSGGAWSAMPHGGLNYDVRAFAVVGSDLYVGGEFNQSADGALTLNNIAKFSAGAWEALPHGGLNNVEYAGDIVASLVVSGSDLYVGGNFSQTADGAISNLNSIAKLSGGEWSALSHNGLTGLVMGLAVSGGDLFVGGNFAHTADGAVANLNHVAKYNSSEWSAMANSGLNRQVFAIVAGEKAIYVGGEFYQTADGAVTNLNHVARLSLASPPLIFVHGVAGSTLVKNGNEIWIGTPYLTSRRELSLIDSPPASVIATNAMSEALGIQPVYGPLLNYLKTTGGYVEYAPPVSPATGCNTSQPGSKPNLFVFAYDWRIDNDANADKLRTYIDCVRLIHPEARVNLLAHSMGGLLSRRYILKYYNGVQADNGHHVNALITIGSPFLGAPKLNYVLETGNFIDSPIHIATGDGVKYAAQTLTAAHQLLPSRRYAEVSGGVPLAEAGWDLDADGVVSETYSYDDLLAVMNHRYVNTPGATGDAFHSYTRAWGGQDDWSADSTGVQYYHLYGVRSVADTIGQVHARVAVACNGDLETLRCEPENVFMPVYTIGDKTVPVRSATKQGNGFNYNAPSAQLFRYFGPSANGDDLTEHTGLTQNPLVQAKILELIAQSANPVVSTARSQLEVQDDPVLPAHYLLINGATQVIVRDALGNSTAPLQGDLLGSVPGATDTVIGDHVSMLTLAASGDYTVTFDTTDRPLATELTTGTDVTTTQIIRYLDVSLPISVTAMLRLRPGETEVLRYDADGDGSFESVLTPTINVSGTTALDTTPPTLTLVATGTGATRQVTITAQDDGSGVKNLRYSVDGTNFRPYTSTVTFDWTAYPTLHALSDDNMANRSVLVYPIGRSTYLPLMIR